MDRYVDIIQDIPPETREQALAYFGRIFGRRAPLTVEIGSGNGHFLVSRAMAEPQRDFVGTEILGGRARKFHAKITKRTLRNIAVFKGDGRRFVWEYLFRDMVSEFVVMFPDPWPKEKHHKHRILKRPFLQMLRARLQPGGTLTVVTDDRGYRDWILEQVAGVSGFVSLFPGGYTDYPQQHHASLFELRFRERGRNIFSMRYLKQTGRTVTTSEGSSSP
jgi:tRNA (guanine-N7-)-methyltransferase